MSKHQASDQTLYCERCGISFLWSSEEQLVAAEGGRVTRPQHCPGCRELLPASDRERGLVKWFNHRKRYGFLTRAEMPDLFVHRSALSDTIRLRPGDLVEFSVTDGERGPAASEVILLIRNEPAVQVVN